MHFLKSLLVFENFHNKRPEICACIYLFWNAVFIPICHDKAIQDGISLKSVRLWLRNAAQCTKVETKTTVHRFWLFWTTINFSMIWDFITVLHLSGWQMVILYLTLYSWFVHRSGIFIPVNVIKKIKILHMSTQNT